MFAVIVDLTTDIVINNANVFVVDVIVARSPSSSVLLSVDAAIVTTIIDVIKIDTVNVRNTDNMGIIVCFYSGRIISDVVVVMSIAIVTVTIASFFPSLLYLPLSLYSASTLPRISFFHDARTFSRRERLIAGNDIIWFSSSSTLSFIDTTMFPDDFAFHFVFFTVEP